MLRSASSMILSGIILYCVVLVKDIHIIGNHVTNEWISPWWHSTFLSFFQWENGASSIMREHVETK
jgi:hypothetical protein